MEKRDQDTWERSRMGLLDTTNPRATLRSVLLRAIQAAVVGAITFFLAFKPAYREAWPVTLPIWCLFCAFVGALFEWQGPRGSDEDDEIGEGHGHRSDRHH
jgi:hypothetical protein